MGTNTRKDIDKEVIGIDGKAVKGSAQKSKGIKSLYYVSAYACENQLVLCQQVVEKRSCEMIDNLTFVDSASN